MMVGVVSRLTWQKGFYLLMEQLDALCAAQSNWLFWVVVKVKLKTSSMNLKMEIKERFVSIMDTMKAWHTVSMRQVICS